MVNKLYTFIYRTPHIYISTFIWVKEINTEENIKRFKPHQNQFTQTQTLELTPTKLPPVQNR